MNASRCMPTLDDANRTDKLRNQGLDRLPEKRGFLALIKERCEKSGIEPLKANF